MSGEVFAAGSTCPQNYVKIDPVTQNDSQLRPEKTSISQERVEADRIENWKYIQLGQLMSDKQMH
jgi:hypothetical protein